jgi:mono/diheme cytochrome c family protein
MRIFNRFISTVLLTLLATQTFADVSAGKDIVTRKGCAGCHGGSSLEGSSDSANLSVLTSDEHPKTHHHSKTSKP